MDLATSHEDKPAVASAVYVIDEDLNFYFVTYRVSLKAQNLINNPQQFDCLAVPRNVSASLRDSLYSRR